MLPVPSDEQADIISWFDQGFNIKIEAVAGSGKTTTLMYLAIHAKTKFNAKTLLLTYNRDLKDEISSRLSQCGLNSHCAVYTYHGIASKIYKSNIHNDKLLYEHLKKEPRILLNYDIVLLDEVQDMNENYHKLVKLILKHGAMLVLVGDENQCINGYIGASANFLINHDIYFDTGRPWKVLSLRTSYRLTPLMADFVNTHIIKADTILAGNNRTNKADTEMIIYNFGIWDIEGLVRMQLNQYTPNDMIILVPSIKITNNPRSPIGKLLSSKREGMLFCVKDTDTDSEIMVNKIVVTSYNSMKGRERRCVIVTGFDESYFEYYDKKWNGAMLPNIIYVAATRATEKLILIQDKDKLPFRTIDISTLYQTCKIHGTYPDAAKPPNTKPKKSSNVTDLIKHMNLNDTINLLSFLTITETQTPITNLECKNIIPFDGYYEDMKSYYGTLIPLYTQYLMHGTTHLETRHEIIQMVATFDDKFTDIIQRYNTLVECMDKTLNQWMELVVMHHAIISNHHFYKDQIKHYDWVDSNFIIEASNQLFGTIPKDGKFEVGCGSGDIDGTIDYLCADEIWEFKCTSSLSDEHKIQCGVYIALYYRKTGEILPVKLLNARTGQIFMITLDDPSSFLLALVNK